ncbi:hypothetical protein PENTCL1PPCAC_10739, partial [Pristionchus entomophagus]
MNKPTRFLFALSFARVIGGCMYCGRPFSSILPPLPLPPLPDMNFGFRPYIPPISRPEFPRIPIPPMPFQSTYIPFQFQFSRECQISPSFRLLDVDDGLVANISEAVRDWRYDLVSDLMQDLLAEQVTVFANDRPISAVDQK